MQKLVEEYVGRLTEAYRGDVFEAYAHRVLRDGGTFTVRNLQTGIESTIFITRSAPRKFTTLIDLQTVCATSTQSTYAIPSDRNFPVIDSVIVPGGQLFQMTYSLSHPLSMHHLESILSTVQSQHHPTSLYFVVPSDQFALFQEQKYLTKKGKIAKRLPLLVSQTTQYVLSIEF
jgi:hypothetical protein